GSPDGSGPSGTSAIRRDAPTRPVTSAGGPVNVSGGSPGTSTRTVTVGGPATVLAWNRIRTRPPLHQVPGLVAVTRYCRCAKPATSPTVHSALAGSPGPATRSTQAVRPPFSKKPRRASGVALAASGAPNAATTSFRLSTRTG